MSSMYMFKVILLSAALSQTSQSVFAKPLITDSEKTFESVCLDYGDSPARLIEICRKGLASGAAAQGAQLDMMDTLAWALGQEGDDAAARKTYEEMLALDPGNAEALTGLGWQAHDQSDYAAAAELFEQAMARKPDEEALGGLASSLKRSGQKTLDEILPLLDAAIAIDPDYDWALRERGWLLSGEERYEAALAAFQQALDLDPDDGYAHYGMASVLSDLEDWDAALVSVNRTLQSLPDFASALSQRSLIFLYQDRPAQALRDAERVIELRPNDSDGYVRAARAQVDLGWTRLALETLDDAQQIVGYEGYLYYWRAKVQDLAQRPEEALETLAEVFAHGDADYYDHSLRSSLLIDLQEYAAARVAVDAALKEYPEAPWLMFYDAVLMVQEDAFERAEQRFDAAVAAGLPQDRLSYFLTQLTGAARYVQVVQMRVRYADQAAAQGQAESN